MIPKALIHIQTSLAVSPTEEQLLEFFKPYGYETIEDILEGHSGGLWDEVIREWFVNTYYGQDYKELCEKKNIFNYDSDNQEDEVEILDDGQWDEMNDEGLIF
jgi:hypothetical protein